MRHVTSAVLGIALLATVACQDDPITPSPAVVEAAASASSTGKAGLATYAVTVMNLTDGQPFTPPLAVTHGRSLDVFEVGAAASYGVKEIAENGNLAPLQAAMAGNKHAAEVVIAAGSPPPILPAMSRTFTISGDQGAKYLSMVAMLICSNDGFTGLDAVRLPRDVGESATYDAMAYDAGTEVNTEDFADLVPPCAPLTGVPTTKSGTGASNPTLAENGVVGMHGGILGGVDLIPALHGWSGPVARITITRSN